MPSYGKSQRAVLEMLPGMEAPSSGNAAHRLLPMGTPILPGTGLREKVLPIPPLWHRHPRKVSLTMARD